jgi:hypothetical protein
MASHQVRGLSKRTSQMEPAMGRKFEDGYIYKLDAGVASNASRKHGGGNIHQPSKSSPQSMQFSE